MGGIGGERCFYTGPPEGTEHNFLHLAVFPSSGSNSSLDLTWSWIYANSFARQDHSQLPKRCTQMLHKIKTSRYSPQPALLYVREINLSLFSRAYLLQSPSLFLPMCPTPTADSFSLSFSLSPSHWQCRLCLTLRGRKYLLPRRPLLLCRSYSWVRVATLRETVRPFIKAYGKRFSAYELWMVFDSQSKAHDNDGWYHFDCSLIQPRRDNPRVGESTFGYAKFCDSLRSIASASFDKALTSA